jgi:hypothetical protein
VGATPKSRSVSAIEASRKMPADADRKEAPISIPATMMIKQDRVRVEKNEEVAFLLFGPEVWTTRECARAKFFIFLTEH